jgi:hypothetical protein
MQRLRQVAGVRPQIAVQSGRYKKPKPVCGYPWINVQNDFQ